MKKLLVGLSLIFISTIAHGDTFNQYWYNESDLYAQTSCQTGGDINLPATAPTKYGYDFIGWEKLPYTPLQYIESTGTQWIDTGVIPTLDMRIKYVFSGFNFTSNENRILWGSRTSGTYQTSTNQFYAGCSEGYAGCWYYSATQQKHLGDFSSGTRYTYDVTNDSNVTDSVQSIYLFALNNNGTAVPNPDWRLYSLKIYSASGAMIRDFIPVLSPGGAPCMLDKVSGQFFYNQGTGDFIAGPVL